MSRDRTSHWIRLAAMCALACAAPLAVALGFSTNGHLVTLSGLQFDG